MDGPSTNKNIMVIEDDADVRNALTLILNTEGYHVVGVANGKEAIEKLRTDPPPALILLDLMMPVMDGWEFRDWQRHHPTLRAIPVVVVSADESIRSRTHLAGIAGFLQKPIEYDLLLNIVRRYY
jgi:CheY-like chemotaxis protein